jgi:hypothetical protein
MPTDKLVALCAVGVVAVASLGAALLVGRHEPSDAVVAGVGQVNTSGDAKEVVTAPPLKAAPGSPARNFADAGQGPATNAMGAGRVCADCGVVQMVVAVYEHGQPRANGYQMHIRMDDGSIRTVQQRGALAPGSRVMVEGETVRIFSEPSRPG